jgi:hypothetical protein
MSIKTVFERQREKMEGKQNEIIIGGQDFAKLTAVRFTD